MQKLFIIMLLVVTFFLSFQTALATSAYVLPYPSTMPGGISYKLHVFWEKVMQYWYFGDYGQFEYNLKESDKYLVEAKTLFEYNQYLLGYEALQKSNAYFTNIYPFLVRAKVDGKDITDKENLLKSAAQKHIEVLQTLAQQTPQTVNWSPEKSAASTLSIGNLIMQSIRECQKIL